MQRYRRRISGLCRAGAARGISPCDCGIKMEKSREDYPVKAFLAAALILALGITGISLWGAVHAQRMTVSSSQIYIDGTPVCVMQQGGDITASLGMCGTPGSDSPEGGFGNGGVRHRGTPYPLQPRHRLPPGHPPVGLPPDMEEGRRILI